VILNTVSCQRQDVPWGYFLQLFYGKIILNGTTLGFYMFMVGHWSENGFSNQTSNQDVFLVGKDDQLYNFISFA